MCSRENLILYAYVASITVLPTNRVFYQFNVPACDFVQAVIKYYSWPLKKLDVSYDVW